MPWSLTAYQVSEMDMACRQLQLCVKWKRKRHCASPAATRLAAGEDPLPYSLSQRHCRSLVSLADVPVYYSSQMTKQLDVTWLPGLARCVCFAVKTLWSPRQPCIITWVSTLVGSEKLRKGDSRRRSDRRPAGSWCAPRSVWREWCVWLLWSGHKQTAAAQRTRTS